MHYTLPVLLSDFYKQCHWQQYSPETTKIVSYFTPRMSRISDQHLVCFGIQYFCKKYLVDVYKERFFNRDEGEVVDEYHKYISTTLHEVACNDEMIRKLHRLGYLPLQIKALPEGTLVPVQVPMIEISNTHPDFAWLTNYIESLMSAELWHTMISANVGYSYRNVVDWYYHVTVDDARPAKALGDFSFRGQHCLESATKSSAAFCLSFLNTATVPAIPWLEYYYNCDCERDEVAYGALSTEHSVMCSNYILDGNEKSLVRRLLTSIYKGIPFSMVGDSFDYWNMLTRILPSLKEEVKNHRATFLIRGDSGDPVKIICGDPQGKTEAERKGTVELLWDIFGGTLNSKGYRVLPSYIRAIYGDSITQQRCSAIYRQLQKKGFAANNVSLGVGSFSFMCLEEEGILQPYTRDTFGIAIKSTYGEAGNRHFEIYKDPKTDTGHFKKSQRGMCRVYKNNEGSLAVEDNLLPGVDKRLITDNLLRTVFLDGELHNQETLAQIRNRLHGGNF